LKCRILPNCECPEERKFDRDLDEYTPKNRGRLVAALLTIIRAYVVAGFPHFNQLTPFRTYSSFTRFVRGPLVWLGKPDPYESAKEIKENDPETEEAGILFAAWHEAVKLFPLEYIAVKKLVEIATDPEQRKKTAMDSEFLPVQVLYEILLEQFPDKKGNAEIDAGSLGASLAKMKGRIIKGFQLNQLMKPDGKEALLDRKGKAQWRVVIH
jgi:putative DNA primase/helicase